MSGTARGYVICRMQDLEAEVAPMRERIEALEQVVAGLVEAAAEPEDALASLHAQFRAKCRKAEGLS